MTAEAPDVVELLRELIRFDTTNPPGNETACVAHVRGLLRRRRHRVAHPRAAPTRARTSIARVRGPRRGAAAPPLRPRRRRHHRRPAVDAPAVRGRTSSTAGLGPRRARHEVRRRDARRTRSSARARRGRRRGRPRARGAERRGERRRLRRALPRRGARRPVRGRSATRSASSAARRVRLGGRSFYPIQVAEKQICWLRGVVRGPGGHAAIGVRGSAMGKLGRILAKLDSRQAPGPRHAGRARLDRGDGGRAAAAAVARSSARCSTRGSPRRRCASPRTEQLRPIDRALRNTVSATIVHGGEKINVDPVRGRARARRPLAARLRPRRR